LLTAPTPESDRNNVQHQLASAGARRRVFTVHRLDLQTSGILIFAKTQQANRLLSEIFRIHDIVRKYDALVLGPVDFERRTVNSPIAGKPATTHFTLLQRHARFSWLEARLETGRTHQIRLHARGLGHEVLADPAYGQRLDWSPPRLALHAKHLALTHPISGAELEFSSPLAQDLTQWLERQR
jgi:23S rRNA pseudouridine1911/1915/1917 synthase